MKILLTSLILIILQEICHEGTGHAYKAVTTKGDTGTVYTERVLCVGDTLKI